MATKPLYGHRPRVRRKVKKRLDRGPVKGTKENMLGIFDRWHQILTENERAWLSGNVESIRTDPDLVRAMMKWFPGRKSKLMYCPVRVRAILNRRAKEVRYYRYVKDPKKGIARATSRGLPVDGWKKPKVKKG